MKLATNLTIKLFLIISLFVSVGFAEDGNMPTGGFASGGTDIVCDEDGNMPTGGISCLETDNADEDGNMPTGGRTALTNNQKSEDSILNFVKNYLFSLFG